MALFDYFSLTTLLYVSLGVAFTAMFFVVVLLNRTSNLEDRILRLESNLRKVLNGGNDPD